MNRVEIFEHDSSSGFLDDLQTRINNWFDKKGNNIKVVSINPVMYKDKTNVLIHYIENTSDNKK